MTFAIIKVLFCVTVMKIQELPELQLVLCFPLSPCLAVWESADWGGGAEGEDRGADNRPGDYQTGDQWLGAGGRGQQRRGQAAGAAELSTQRGPHAVRMPLHDSIRSIYSTWIVFAMLSVTSTWSKLTLKLHCYIYQWSILNGPMFASYGMPNKSIMHRILLVLCIILNVLCNDLVHCM